MKHARPLRIALAPDSFKGSMTALQAAKRIEKGLRRVWPDVETVIIPMADGGDGTVRTLVDATGGRMVHRTVRDPLGRPVQAAFGLSGDGQTAVIEMAAASGLVLLEPGERNPLKTSTYGTGELMALALAMGARHLLVGIGGSATNDAGMGMAQALGIKFLDDRGRELPGCGASLERVSRIETAGRDAHVGEAMVEVACDVNNPLAGKHGAAHVYAPQKGASPADVERLDAGLKHFAGIVKRDTGVRILSEPGAGAAGGLGGGLMAFAGGKLRRGIDIVIDSVDLRAQLKGCDLVITGEGRMDGQTAHGKTPAGVADVAKELGLPVIALCGCLGDGVRKVLSVGIDAYTATLTRSIADAEIPGEGPRMLTDCAEQVARIMTLSTTLRRLSCSKEK